ncbi:hypothetical protein FOMPIDRAFT_16687, partial [Fomitopsis schrenkii]
PGLTNVIPAMDIIDEQPATSALNLALDPAIRVAVSLGKRSINHYYNKSDESVVYHIAMVLDPWSKLEYFRECVWLDEWITEACTLVQEAYDEDWKGHAEPCEQQEDSEEPQAQVS